MKERSILFSDEMVRAILDGRKTQTRRAIKTRGPAKNLDKWTERVRALESPYGRIGERLWVREAWRVGAWRQDGRVAIDYRASPEIIHTPWLYPDAEAFENLWIQSTDDCQRSGLKENEHGFFSWNPGCAPTRWRPSIFMRRWASRITLEIVEVRVQRLQDISEADAKAEGVEPGCEECGEIPHHSACLGRNDVYVDSFVYLWNSINARRGFGWHANPWVFALTFKMFGR